MELDAILSETAVRYPERIAVRNQGQDYSYRQLDERVERAACALRNLGLVPGDRLAYQLRNTRIESLVVMFGALRAGLVLVPIPLAQGPAQIAYTLQHCATRALVIEPEFLLKLQPEQRAGVEWVIVVGPAVDGTLNFEDLPVEPRIALPQPVPGEDAICLIVYTSGTTSQPKGVAHAQLRLRMRVELFVDEMGFGPEDATMPAIDMGRPLVFLSQVLAMFRVGGQLLIPGSPKSFWEEYARHGGISYLVSTPAGAMTLLDQAPAGGVSHKALRYWLCGGDKVQPRVHERFVQVIGFPATAVYGMTEAGFVATTPIDGEPRPGSVGKLMCGVMARVVDPSGEQLPPGSVGEILVRTPNTMVGYWNDTIGTFRIFKEQWIRSGDLGHFDEDGYLWITGRSKQMISRGGMKVAPPMVEDALREHPAILDAVVVAQSDPLQGQVPFAFYLLNDPAVDVERKALVEWLGPRVPVPSIPEGFVALPSWPMTAQGKIDRTRLAWLAEAGGISLG